jgi:hypothetical protein
MTGWLRRSFQRLRSFFHSVEFNHDLDAETRVAPMVALRYG